MLVRRGGGEVASEEGGGEGGGEYEKEGGFWRTPGRPILIRQTWRKTRSNRSRTFGALAT